jgi:DNA primase large subunit
MEPTAARAEPITKVMEITELILMPMSLAVSKSFDTARMAMPIFVWRIRVVSSSTSATASTGVMRVTRDADTPPI